MTKTSALSDRCNGLPARKRTATWRRAVVGSAVAAMLGASTSQVRTEPAPADDINVRIAAARAASKELGEKLKNQLMAAITNGGVISAIPVCKTIAPQIGSEVSAAHKLDIRRTALKVRNPANAPDAFERKALEDFAAKFAAGADPMTVDFAETVSEGGKTTFRYMKAIPTAAEPCLACHGSALKDDVKTEIAKLYPADAATGFAAGALRGAFSVRQVIK